MVLIYFARKVKAAEQKRICKWNERKTQKQKKTEVNQIDKKCDAKRYELLKHVLFKQQNNNQTSVRMLVTLLVTFNYSLEKKHRKPGSGECMQPCTGSGQMQRWHNNKIKQKFKQIPSMLLKCVRRTHTSKQTKHRKIPPGTYFIKFAS